MKQKQNINSLLESYLNGTMTPEQKKAVDRAREIDARKMQAWDNVAKSTKSHRSIGKIMMRYAAMLVPLLVIGLVWAGDIKAFLLHWGENSNRTETVAPAIGATSADLQNMHIRFDRADLSTVTATLMTYYPEIKGLKSDVKDDTIKVTTTFDHQSLNEVLEELNIHFGHNFALDSDGYLVISD